MTLLRYLALLALLTTLTFDARTQSDEGVGIDPNGVARTDGGGAMDPNGG